MQSFENTSGIAIFWQNVIFIVLTVVLIFPWVRDLVFSNQNGQKIISMPKIWLVPQCFGDHPDSARTWKNNLGSFLAVNKTKINFRLNSRTAIDSYGYYWPSLACFYSSKKLNCIRALFFKIVSNIFMIFEVKLEWWFWSRRSRKKRVVLRRETFALILKYWENGVWT